MSILVTGATGFIGSNLCQELVQRGDKVIGLTRSGNTRRITTLISNRNFNLYTGDIQDTSAMCRILKDNQVKTIFHLAAHLSNGINLDNPQPYFDINTRGTLNMLNAAYTCGAAEFIYASSMSVYSEPPQFLLVNEDHPTQPDDLYGATKMAAELFCRAYAESMNVVVLRYAGVYGPGCRESDAVPVFMKQALSDQPLTVYGSGRQSSDFVYIDDIIQGNLLAWEKHVAGVYNIGSGRETSVNELAAMILKITGSRSKVILTGKETKRPYRFVMDIAKAKGELGYTPHSIEEGLRRYMEALKKQV